jgi:hypothetical protein
MQLPICLKSGLPALGCALAGFATAAWLMPSAAPGPASPVMAARPAHSLLGKAAAPAATVQAYLDVLCAAGTPSQQMAAALRCASLGHPDEIRALLDQAHRFPAHSASTLAAQILLKRWLELDPAAALEYSRLHFDKILPKLLGTWSAAHPAEAEAWILALPGGGIKTDAWQELCATTATRDPGKAWDLLERSPSLSGSDGYEVRNLIEKLTAQDLEGTMARLSSLPAMLLKNARNAITKQLMQTDPARGWEWARQQPNPNELISNAIQVTLRKNPAQAFAWLETIPAAQRKRLMNEHGYNWGGGDSAALATALSGNSGFSSEEKQKLAQKFLINATWTDLAGAASFLPLLEGPELIQGMQNYLKSYNTKHGTTETAAWIAALSPGGLRTAAEGVWRHKEQFERAPQGRSTPASLVTEFKKSSYIQEDDARLSQINAVQLAEIMVEEARGRSYHTGRILTGLAKTNPAPAAAWFASVPADEKTGPQAAQFSATWAQEDPAAAAAWVSSLPAGDLAANVAANVARQYQHYAPQEAQAWLKTLTAGPVREAAAQAMETKP